jgi:hypothetical protein
MLRFYYPQVDIEGLSDDDWCRMVSEMDYVLKHNGTLFNKENG